MDAANKPLNILHVHTLTVISGSGINTLLTMVGSRRRGNHVGLACQAEGGLTREAAAAGLDIHLVPSLGRELNPARDLQSIFELTQLMRRGRFDIVHTHNSKAGFVGRLAARLARVPLVIHTVHGFAFHDAESASRRVLYRSLERAAAFCCDGMIFISRPLEDWAAREHIGRGLPHRVIYSGIDVASFRAADGAEVRRQLAIPPACLVVGIVSKLWQGKGHEVLLRAWQKLQIGWAGLQRPVLLVVGEGPLDAGLRRLASDLDIGQTVIFTGFRADIPQITAAIDVSVLPSAFEGMGRVILEAMAAGKPVVASNVGGIPDIVHPGVTGLLIPPNDIAALYQSLYRLLTDPSLRHAMSSAASAALEPKYSATVMIDDIHAFYDSVSQLK